MATISIEKAGISDVVFGFLYVVNHMVLRSSIGHCSEQCGNLYEATDPCWFLIDISICMGLLFLQKN